MGRSLTTDEARDAMNMARRLAAIILMESALNENYQEMKKSSYTFATSGNNGL